MNFQEGAMGSPTELTTLLRFWEQMEKLHYPMAGDMVKSLRSEQELQQAQLQMQMQPAVEAGTSGGAETVAPEITQEGGEWL